MLCGMFNTSCFILYGILHIISNKFKFVQDSSQKKQNGLLKVVYVGCYKI